MKSKSNDSVLKDYYYLTKPGIIRGNLLAMLAGFFFAARGDVNITLLVATTVGLSLVIASGCVCNNYIDRGIDKQMSRTKNRALVTGRIPSSHALIYAAVLGLIGLTLLAVFSNILTAGLALFGHFAYVVLYGVFKRRSSLGTVVGSLSGAIPPVVGYTAVSNQIDTGALLLFLILVFWQMPHFYAIAMYRKKDYSAAKIPVLPVSRGARITKIEIIAYVIGFTIVATSFTLLGYASMVYGLIMACTGILWLLLGLRGFSVQNDEQWSRKMFLFSLITLTTFCIVLTVDSFFFKQMIS